jgi:hypothetical protein
MVNITNQDITNYNSLILKQGISIVNPATFLSTVKKANA